MFELQNINKTFVNKYTTKTTKSVDDVSMKISEGEVVGLLGPSGCGKTTLARIAMKLIKMDSGSIIFEGEDITDVPLKKCTDFRKNVQMVFQNPTASMDPLRTVKWSLDEAYNAFGFNDFDYCPLCDKFEIPYDILERRPSMVSGGEIQRVSIMRCLASDPKYMIMDEPTSMLDVSIQASVMAILRKLNKDMKKGILIITHDIDLAEVFCDRIYLMNNGKIVEHGESYEILNNPTTKEGKEFVESYRTILDQPPSKI